MEFNFNNFQQGTLFGGTVEDLVKKEKEATGKKDKKEKAKSTGKGTQKAKKTQKISCPVNIYTPYGIYTANETEGFIGEVDLDAVIDWMVEKGFAALKSNKADFVYTDGNLYMAYDTLGMDKDRQIIQWGENSGAELTVVDGMYCAYYKSENFEKETVTVGDVMQKFREENTGYENVKLSLYDPLSNVIVILGEDVIRNVECSQDRAKSLSVDSQNYELEADATLKDLCAAFLVNEPVYHKVSKKLSFMLKDGTYLPVLSDSSSSFTSKQRFHVTGNTEKAKEKELTYPAPVVVKTMFGSFTVGEKGDEMSIADIQEYLKSHFTEFSSKKFSLEYINGANCFQALVYSSQKGAGIDLNVGSFFVEDFRLMNFQLKEGLKIPADILEQVISLFREDLSLEAMVQIWYHETDGFVIVSPEIEVVEKAYICCSMNTKTVSDMVMDDRAVLVATVHSHNNFAARFSYIDDLDEQGPGIFAVIGDLIREIPSISVRAAYNGSFSYMSYHDIFHTERIFEEYYGMEREEK